MGVRELRQNLSVYLRRVKEGEAFEVTEYGRPVALLRPPPRSDDLIDRLEAEGKLARRASGDLLELGPPLKLQLDRPLSEILQEMRDDERF